MAKRRVAPVLAAALVVAAFAATATSVRAIGVCYGVFSSIRPSKSDVVELYKSNGIANMRFYFSDHELLDALRGSGIGLALDVGNEHLADLASNPAAAASWVKDNVQDYYPDVNIRYIVVGNEVDGAVSVLQAMQNVHDALTSANLADSIKVSTAVKMNVLDDNSSPPSNGVFRDPSVMSPIVQFLANNGAPLLANVYPYFAYKDSQGIELNYALFEPSSTTVVDTNGLTYTNLFDAMVDAVHAALEKAGFGSVDVVVSESGWPSADGRDASVENARTYNQNLISHAGQGTPRKPGPMEVYVFAMFNEDQKRGDPTEKHFGLFKPEDKTPVYPINFA
ncbi:glucan endo-1,3-beta-glucosidase GII-like [Panicum miliaceum]|uniref:Glucan endo-1,3-beta-glucosidase GII-like n=1 Tax=Panicum miliaceum TaxID=4540 RepID=A0A3L6SL37_PANMI|nr:glucan endo-1,3-beta-glucosidase GII-like [Panicum miliaceum]